MNTSIKTTVPRAAKNTVPKTIPGFAKACKNKSHAEIYDLFENKISEELRDALYCFSPMRSPEPVRWALNELGRLYHIDALINY